MIRAVFVLVLRVVMVALVLGNTAYAQHELDFAYLDGARAQGGLAGFMHPYLQKIDEPGDAANSLIPVDVALGKGDFYDVATIYGFLQRHGLEREVKINIEQNHALLAGHTFEHEIALAQALGIFGSIDMNRGDELLGWDTVHFPTNLSHAALAMYQIVKGGGFTTGGLNFDAKVRRQSIDPEDVVIAHADAVDLCARALLIAAKMIEEGELAKRVSDRYAGWDGKLGRGILAGRQSLSGLAAFVEKNDLEPQPRSGHQERYEALVNRYI